MAQKQQGSVAAGVTVAAMLILVLASIGYYQYVYIPSVPTSTTTSSVVSNIKTVIVNITLNAVSACGGASGVQSSLPSKCDAYSPNPIRLVAGVNNSVVFNNLDTAVHTATANDKSFDTGILNSGQQSDPMVIDKTGTITYYCTIHPWMKGELIVVAGSGAPPSQTSSSTTGSSSTAQTVGSSLSSSSSKASGVSVSIINGAGTNQSSPGYSPTAITVVIGVNNTITWSNGDTSPHTVTARNGAFDSKNMNSGATFSFTFTNAGTYDYYCKYHPWMKGTVVVKG